MAIRSDTVRGGPLTESALEVAAFCVVSAPDLDVAVRIAQLNPATRDGGVELGRCSYRPWDRYEGHESAGNGPARGLSRVTVRKELDDASCRTHPRLEKDMNLLDGACREVLEATEFVAMVTAGPQGPHITATWGDYVRQLGFEGDRLVIPAGYYHQMETNLEQSPDIQLLVASRKVEGKLGPGQGFTLKGTGKIFASGADMDRVKTHFPWARGALVVQITEAVSHL